MGFYGNITNVNKSTFQFDKIYPNRAEMDDGAATDGIFVGRYVLVDYDQGSTIASIIQELEDEYSVDITDSNFVIAYKRMWYSEIEDKYLNELDDYNQVILQPSVSESPDAERYGVKDGIILNDKTFALVIGAIKIKETTITDEETGTSSINKTYYLDLDITPEVYYCTKGEEKVDNIVGYEYEKDDNGNIVYQQVYDEENNPVYEIDGETGEQVLDEEGQPIPVVEPVYALDENGEKIPVYETDENGEKVWYSNYYLKTELITDLVAPSGLYKKEYLANYNRDASRYGKSIGRGWDSTVWQKTFKDGGYEYVMIAELNSVVPTFDIAIDAPTETPLKPHYDADNSNVYYRLHFQPSWGMRVKAAGGGAEIDSYSADKKHYPSDLAGKFVIDSSIKYDDTSEHHVINKQVTNTPLAVYFDKKSFNKYWDSEVETISDGTMDDAIYLTPSGYSGNQYYAHATKENDALVDDGSETMKVKYPDTYELSIMLPSIGQSISEMWDIVYGVGAYKDSTGNYLWNKDDLRFADKDTGILIRNTDVRWNSKAGLRTLDYPKGNPNEEFDSLAGAINSVHDLMGMIIIAPKAPKREANESSTEYLNRFVAWHDGLFSDTAIAAWDPAKIYEIPTYEIIENEPVITGQKFYRKSKEYSYLEEFDEQSELNAHINENDFTPVTVIDVTSGDYYKKDAAQFPNYEDKDGESAVSLSRDLYNNYIKVDNNSLIYDGGIYGTINFYNNNVITEETSVTLSAEDYNKDELYFKTPAPGAGDASIITAYKLDTNSLPSSLDGEYYRLTVGESTADKKFYYPNLYYVGIVNSPDSSDGWTWDSEAKQWNNSKDEWDSSDFDTVSLCIEDSLADTIRYIKQDGDTADTIPGYKFFEGVNAEIKETDTLIEDEYNPILRRNVIAEYNNGIESSRQDIVIYSEENEEGTRSEYARYVYNENTDTWDFTFTYNLQVDLETSTTYGIYNTQGSKTYIEQLPNSEVFITPIENSNKVMLSLYTYLCQDSPSVLNGFTLAEIISQGNHSLTLKNDNTPKIIYRLIRKKVSIYDFSEAEIVNLEDFDPSKNYYYNTYLADPDYPGGEGHDFEAWAAAHSGNYQYWIQETMAGDNLEERLKNTTYYQISVERTAVYYNLAQGYYYKDAANNFIKETVIRMKPSVNDPSSDDYKKYYKLIEGTGDGIVGFRFNPIEGEPFIPNKYYYQPIVNGPFVLATEYIDGTQYYKKNNALYVRSTTTDFVEVGAEWNRAVTTLPNGVVLSHRTETWGYEELPEFAERYNTINGLILNLYKKLLPNDTLTRDLTTVQGSINTLNDIIDKFNELVPAEIVMIDEYGRIHSADKDSEQSVTAINYGIADAETDSGFAAGVVEDIEDKVEAGKNANDERWIKLTTTDGEFPDYKPHIKLEHTLNHKVTPTVTAADKNTPYTDLTLPQENNGLGLNNNNSDTLKLYTPIVDNMGHIVGNNTETVTLPYGFKIITTNGRNSNNNTTTLVAQNDIIAENTQDTLGINSGNEWIKIETNPTSDTITISHDVKNTTTSTSSLNLTTEIPGTTTFEIPSYSFDATNHFTNVDTKTVTMPNSYGKFTGDNEVNGIPVVSEATATHDTFSITGDTWITTTVEPNNGALRLAHTNAHTATTSVGENGSSYQFGSTFQVLNVGIDDKGHIKDLSTHNVTIPQGDLTDAAANGADVITQLSFDKPTGMLSSTRTNIGALTLTGYNLNNNGSSETAIAAADTLNTALQRIEYRLNKEITDRTDAVSAANTALTTAIGSANDASTADTINGAKAYADSLATNYAANDILTTTKYTFTIPVEDEENPGTMIDTPTEKTIQEWIEWIITNK